MTHRRQMVGVYFAFFFVLSILFIGLIERAYDQAQAPVVPATETAPTDR